MIRRIHAWFRHHRHDPCDRVRREERARCAHAVAQLRGALEEATEELADMYANYHQGVTQRQHQRDRQTLDACRAALENTRGA